MTDTPSTSTPPAAAPQQRTVADWVHIMHNATLSLQDDPNNAKLHKIVQVAKQGLRTAAAQASDREEAALAPGAAGAFTVNFGQGASAGLAQTSALRAALMAVPGGEAVMQVLGSTPEQYQDYLWRARMAQPGASAAGDLTGTALTATIAGAPLVTAGAGPVLAGALTSGVPTGVQAGIEGGPTAGVAVGVPAALFGAFGGKVLSKIPLARNVASRVMAKLMGTVPEGTALDAAEAGMRQALQKSGLAAADIDKVVGAERNRMVQEMANSILRPTPAPPVPPEGFSPVGGAVGDPTAIPRPGFPGGRPSPALPPSSVPTEPLAPEGFGRYTGAVGESSAIPKEALPGGKPSPALRPATARTAQATGKLVEDAQEAQIRQALKARNYGTPEQIDDFVQRWKAAKGSMLPPPTVPRVAADAVRSEAFERAATEVPALQPKPPALSAQARPQEVPLVSQYRIAVKQMEEHLGRELTTEERSIVARRFSTPHPGHPFWLGPGAPTE